MLNVKLYYILLYHILMYNRGLLHVYFHTAMLQQNKWKLNPVAKYLEA